MEALRSRGVTLAELAAALAIAGIVMAAASPGFARLAHSAAVAASAQELMVAAHFARSQAILAGVPTRLCLSVDLVACMARAGEPARGFVVEYRDIGREISAKPLKVREFSDRVSVFGTRAAVTYWPVSRSGTTASFEICPHRPDVASRSVIISQTGRPRLRLDASARHSRCLRQDS